MSAAFVPTVPAVVRRSSSPLRCSYCERTIRKDNRYVAWGDQPWHQSCYRITTDETYRPYDIKEGR